MVGLFMVLIALDGAAAPVATENVTCAIHLYVDDDHVRQSEATCPEDVPQREAMQRNADAFVITLLDHTPTMFLPVERELSFDWQEGEWQRDRTYLRRRAIHYPSSGYERSLAAVCRATTMVDRSGEPHSIEVECATSRRRDTGEYFGGNAFEREVRTALEAWRFEPWPQSTEQVACFEWHMGERAPLEAVDPRPC